jgi:hypothetical protein
MKDMFFKKVLITFGFLIEWRNDDKLLECLIGLFQLVSGSSTRRSFFASALCSHLSNCVLTMHSPRLSIVL